jgi:hypothetical protein
MDPATTDLVKTVAAKSFSALKKESQSFLSAVYAEPAKALGGLLTDRINRRRYRNLISITVEAKRLLSEAGLSPKEVPLSIIHPLLEAASLEENPDLQTIWANLLANSADPRHAGNVLPAFSAILKELTSPDVKFLDVIYTNVAERINPHLVVPTKVSTFKYSEDELQSIYSRTCPSIRPPNESPARLSSEQVVKHAREMETDAREFRLTLSTVLRHQILRETVEIGLVRVDLHHTRFAEASGDAKAIQQYAFTDLGFTFVGACRKPEKIGQ